MLIYSNLFWDFDGTLYDSYPQIQRALESTLREFSLPCNAWNNDLQLLKTSVRHALNTYEERFGLPEETLFPCFHKHHQAEGFFPPYVGLRECLTRLKDAGASHYLYTHRGVRAWEQLERDGLRGLFSDGVTAEDGFPYKPAPDALQALIRRHGLAPQSCAMIGDRDIDVQSGQNAGIAGVLFDPDGFYPELKAEGRVKSMAELERWLLA